MNSVVNCVETKDGTEQNIAYFIAGQGREEGGTTTKNTVEEYVCLNLENMNVMPIRCKNSY